MPNKDTDKSHPRTARQPRETTDRSVDDGEAEPRLKDVSHTPSHGDGAERVWDGTRVRPRDDDE